MSAPFPSPQFNDTLGFFEHVNTITDGLAMPVMIMTTVVVIFVMVKNYGYKTSVSAMMSMFLGFIFSSLLWVCGLLAGKYVMALLLLTILCLVYTFFDED
jgi:hypothetical protein